MSTNKQLYLHLAEMTVVTIGFVVIFRRVSSLNAKLTLHEERFLQIEELLSHHSRLFSMSRNSEVQPSPPKAEEDSSYRRSTARPQPPPTPPPKIHESSRNNPKMLLPIVEEVPNETTLDDELVEELKDLKD